MVVRFGEERKEMLTDESVTLEDVIKNALKFSEIHNLPELYTLIGQALHSSHMWEGI